MAASDTTDSSALALATLDDTRPHVAKARKGGRMEQRTLKNVNNFLNTDIYSYLMTTGG